MKSKSEKPLQSGECGVGSRSFNPWAGAGAALLFLSTMGAPAATKASPANPAERVRMLATGWDYALRYEAFEHCALRNTRVGSAPATHTPRATPEGSEWLDGAIVQEAVSGVGQVVEAQPEGILGVHAHDQRRELHVVLDPGLNPDPIVRALEVSLASAPDRALALEEQVVDKADLSEEEKATVAQASDDSWMSEGPNRLSVVIRHGCRSLAELERAGDALAASFRARHLTFRMHLDVATSELVARGPSPSDLRAAARTAGVAPSAVTFEEGHYKLMSRLVDGSPHYGGARIYHPTLGVPCTAGFAVDKHGGRWMTTAGHCLNQTNKSVYSGNSVYFGLSRLVSTSPVDAALIGSGREQYSRVIHTNPCSPCTRLVTHRADLSVGQSVCLSGSVTNAICGIRVDAVNRAWSSDRPDRTPVALLSRQGQALVAPGDSGGPVYQRLSRNRARVMGLIVASDSISGVPTCVVHSLSDVESRLGATLATSCCNSTSW